jgi:hypothetical protein
MVMLREVVFGFQEGRCGDNARFRRFSAIFPMVESSGVAIESRVGYRLSV